MNTANPAKIGKKREAERYRANAIADALDMVLSTREGRAVLAFVLDMGGLWKPSGAPGDGVNEGARLWYRMGQRDLALKVANCIPPKQYAKMIAETEELEVEQRALLEDNTRDDTVN